MAKAQQRELNGILLLDKPAGITSNKALQQVKRKFNARKAGHGGTLDEPATGALPIVLGTYTKLAQYFLYSTKTYECELKLGVSTTTGDASGEPLEEHQVPQLSAARIAAALADLRGEIMQTPPRYSALKYKGRRLHEYARRGESVPLKPRPVTILSLTLQGRTANTISLRLSCSAGTYVRSLANDLGQELGCGAHVQSLRRTALSIIPPKYMVSLAELAAQETPDEYLVPPTELDLGLPKVFLTAAQTAEFLQQKTLKLDAGLEVTKPLNTLNAQKVCVYTEAAVLPPALLALGVCAGSMLCASKVLYNKITTAPKLN